MNIELGIVKGSSETARGGQEHIRNTFEPDLWKQMKPGDRMVLPRSAIVPTELGSHTSAAIGNNLTLTKIEDTITGNVTGLVLNSFPGNSLRGIEISPEVSATFSARSDVRSSGPKKHPLQVAQNFVGKSRSDSIDEKKLSEVREAFRVHFAEAGCYEGPRINNLIRAEIGVGINGTWQEKASFVVNILDEMKESFPQHFKPQEGDSFIAKKNKEYLNALYELLGVLARDGKLPNLVGESAAKDKALGFIPQILS